MEKKKLAEKVVQGEKKKLRRKAKRALHRFVFAVFGAFFLLGTGYFLGVHHRVVEAMIRGEEPPKAPKGHCCH